VRINTAKQLMLQGKPAFGFGLGLGSPRATEALAHSGVDFLLIDTQHGSFGPDSATECLAAAAAGAAIPMARVLRNDYSLIGRLLDEGALGIVVPMVHTAEDARAAADACRFPPAGTRSWGWGRAMNYGSDYSDAINDQLFVAVQIESAEAVENAEAIMAVPGVDGCWVGPSDLALSYGVHPRDGAKDERVIRALDRVLDACRRTGKIPGIACGDAEEARQRADQGFQYVTAGSDIGFLLGGAAVTLRTVR
jgi:4-hydroxy-2-oxoheptanedioate aldolase